MKIKFLLFYFALANCVLCQIPSLPPPKLPESKKAILSPRLAGMYPASANPLTSYIIASRLSGGTNYQWWGILKSSNVANIVTVNLTNAPSPISNQIVISWIEQTTILESADLSNWHSESVNSTKTVVFPNDQPQLFFKVPIPMQSAIIRWNPSPDFQVVGYNVYYGPSSGNYTNIISAGTNTSWLLSGLQPGGVYYFAVTDYNGAGIESAFSEEAKYFVPSNDPPTTIRMQ